MGKTKKQDPCDKLNKNCRKCQYRFKKGDRSVKCPECKEDRHCKTPKMVGKATCRMHGAKGGRPPSPKYILPDKLNSSINRLLEHPELWTLSAELAANTHRTQELLRITEEYDLVGAGKILGDGLDIAQTALFDENLIELQRGLDLIREGRIAELRSAGVWRELRECIKLDMNLKMTNARIVQMREEAISVIEVREVLAMIVEAMMRVIQDPKDRKWVLNYVREHFGLGNAETTN